MAKRHECRKAKTVAVTASRAGWIHADVDPPPGLEVALVEIGSEQFAVLEIPLGLVTKLPLTVAEREVVMAVLRGQSNAEIATSRSVSVRTVANQLTSVYKKLRASSRGDLVRMLIVRAGRRQ